MLGPVSLNGIAQCFTTSHLCPISWFLCRLRDPAHAEIFSCVSDSGQFIVCTEFGSFPGAIEGIHFELQRPKYFVNVYIVLYRVAGFPPGPKNFISMFSLWADVGGDREMGKWCGIKRKRLIEVWPHL